MTVTYEAIASTTLGSAAASYTFTSIPSTFTDLLVVFSGSTTAANSAFLRMNGDTGNNYSMTFLYGSGSSASSGRTSSTGNIYIMDTPTSQSMLSVNIMSYSNTTTFKTALNRGSAAASNVTATVGLYRSTSAITSLELLTNSTFVSGSTFSLYGIKAE